MKLWRCERQVKQRSEFPEFEQTERKSIHIFKRFLIFQSYREYDTTFVVTTQVVICFHFHANPPIYLFVVAVKVSRNFDSILSNDVWRFTRYGCNFVLRLFSHLQLLHFCFPPVRYHLRDHFRNPVIGSDSASCSIIMLGFMARQIFCISASNRTSLELICMYACVRRT